MSTLLSNNVLVHPDDLWPGASGDDARHVVGALQRHGLRALCIASSSQSDVPAILQFADAFRAELLRQVHEAIERAEATNDQLVARELTRRRAELEQAIAERERLQAEIEAAAKRLEVIEVAAHAFRQSVHEATR